MARKTCGFDAYFISSKCYLDVLYSFVFVFRYLFLLTSVFRNSIKNGVKTY